MLGHVKQIELFIITLIIIMICECILFKAEGIVAMIFKAQIYLKSWKKVKLHCFFFFFSHGSSECFKIHNQRLYEIGGNIGKHSLTVFTLKFSDYSKRNMMLLL